MINLPKMHFSSLSHLFATVEESCTLPTFEFNIVQFLRFFLIATRGDLKLNVKQVPLISGLLC